MSAREPEPGPRSATSVSARAEELFAGLLAETRREAADLEALCQRHPELADELRLLHQQWRELGPRLGLTGDVGLEPSPGPSAGERFGNYSIVRLLGAGGMAQVWEAQDLELDRRVALKVLRPGSELAAQRFRREAETGARLSHPSIVAVHARGEHDGTFFIAQELIPRGTTLSHLLDEARRQPALPADHYRRMAELFRQVADALQFAHEGGVVHRDVKPGNILITPDLSPKLTDFGIAQVLGEQSLSGTGHVLGTYLYMSPEQVRGDREGLDARSDVFSLGATLYEALTLQRAFDGDSPPEVAEKILSYDPPPANTLRSRCPVELAVVCERAMEKSPARRYSSMRELAEDLRRFQRHEPIHARPVGTLRRVQKWILRHPTTSLAMGLGLVALGVVSVLLARIVHSEGQEREARILAEQRNEDYHAAANIKKLADLSAEEIQLWPARAAQVPAMEGWLRRADELMHARADLDAVLLRLRTRPAEDPEQAAAEAWLHEQLESLRQALDEFEQQQVASVRERRERALQIAVDTVERHEDDWSHAILSIAESPLYGGLEIVEQVGLVPLDANAQGYWEFWHVESGTRPERDPDRDELIVHGDSGLVMVLLPGGRFWMGCQSEDPTGENHDPGFERNEDAHPVELAPFFLSKYEMSQGQWDRVRGTRPSAFGEGNELIPDWARHPVEMVSQGDCREALRRVGLQLPTEAQWEYGARAGTSTPRWCEGGELSSLVNLADRLYARNFAGVPGHEDWEDGWAAHAPVGHFPANGYGLHEVLGNVWEWCSDRSVPYSVGHRPGDGHLQDEHHPEGLSHATARGGSFSEHAALVRSANRARFSDVLRNGNLGCRPAMSLRRD